LLHLHELVLLWILLLLLLLLLLLWRLKRCLRGTGRHGESRVEIPTHTHGETMSEILECVLALLGHNDLVEDRICSGFALFSLDLEHGELPHERLNGRSVFT
jgi:hypothetical protein